MPIKQLLINMQRTNINIQTTTILINLRYSFFLFLPLIRNVLSKYTHVVLYLILYSAVQYIHNVQYFIIVIRYVLSQYVHVMLCTVLYTTVLCGT